MSHYSGCDDLLDEDYIKMFCEPTGVECVECFGSRGYLEYTVPAARAWELHAGILELFSFFQTV